jgi:exonuclease VII large subunit
MPCGVRLRRAGRHEHRAHRATSNCDHVAAAYADVPARAAELVVPSAAALTAELDRHQVVLDTVPNVLRRKQNDLTTSWVRARPLQGLQRRTLELDGLDGRLEQAAARFYSERNKVLDDARHRLARLRSRVPATAVLDLSSQRLQVAAARLFERRIAELDATAAGLVGARARLPAPADVAELAARLEPAAVRARRRTEDFERAFSRLRDQADRTFARRLRDHDELATVAQRRMSAAQTLLGHTVDLIEAKDYCRSGWLLAGDREGRPVRSAATASPGTELTLHFHDGVIGAAVTHVEPQEGEPHA